jgi:hypothetical protein
MGMLSLFGDDVRDRLGTLNIHKTGKPEADMPVTGDVKGGNRWLRIQVI